MEYFIIVFLLRQQRSGLRSRKMAKKDALQAYSLLRAGFLRLNGTSFGAFPPEESRSMASEPLAFSAKACYTGEKTGGNPMKKNTVDMLHGPVLKPLLRFSVPLVLTGWLQMLFSSADSLVVGRFAGAQALAAVGATFSFVMLIISFFGGLATGVTVCAANDCGSGNETGFRETMHVSLLLSLLVGVFVLGLGEVLSAPVLRMMHAPEDVLDSAVLYLRLYFLCIPAQMVYNTAAALMRAKGDSRHPLLFLAVSGAANLLLNILFVAVFHWDVAGVAAATVLTQYLSAVLGIRALLHWPEPARLNLRELCLRREKVARILKIGVPAGLQVAMLAASDIPLQTAVNSLGSMAVSGNSAALTIDGIIFSTMESFTQACTVFTGQNAGAKQHDRSRTILLNSMAITVLSGLIMGWFGFFLRYPILRLFLPEAPEAVAFGVDRVKAVATMAFLYGVMSSLNSSLRGYGISAEPAAVNIVALFGLRLCWAAFYFPNHRSLFHLYISYPIAWSVAIVLVLSMYRFLLRRAQRKLDGGT